MRRSLAIVVASVALIAAHPASAAGPRTLPPQPEVYWLALGDSYSSGEGLMHNDFASNPPGKVCERATGNSTDTDELPSRAYSRVAYDQLNDPRFGYRLLACTGAVTQDIPGQYAEWAAPSDARPGLITISIGGNNIDFSGIIKHCTGTNFGDGEVEVLRPRCAATEEELRTRVDNLVVPNGVAHDGGPTLYDLYVQMATTMTGSNGHIVVAGYPRIFEDPDSWSGWRRRTEGGRCNRFHPDDARMLNRVSDHLNTTIAGLVSTLNGLPADQRNGVTFHYVDVAALYSGHSLCGDGEGWLNGFALGLRGEREGMRPRYERSFHPNQTGHDATGAAFAPVIAGFDWSQLGAPVTTTTTTTSVPITTGLSDCQALVGAVTPIISDPAINPSIDEMMQALGPGVPEDSPLRLAYGRLGEALGSLAPQDPAIAAAVDAYELSVNEFVATGVMSEDIIARMEDAFTQLGALCPDPIWEV